VAGTRETSIRSYNFYADGTIGGASGVYAENILEFIDVDDQTPFRSHTVLFSNDGATDLEFRFTAAEPGASPHGRVRAGETLQMDFRREQRVYLQGAPGLAYRFWAW
jgi:hypothetical protein